MTVGSGIEDVLYDGTIWISLLASLVTLKNERVPASGASPFLHVYYSHTDGCAGGVQWMAGCGDQSNQFSFERGWENI